MANCGSCPARRCKRRDKAGVVRAGRVGRVVIRDRAQIKAAKAAVVDGEVAVVAGIQISDLDSTRCGSKSNIKSAQRTNENSPAIYRWESSVFVSPSPRSGRQTNTGPLAVG